MREEIKVLRPNYGMSLDPAREDMHVAGTTHEETSERFRKSVSRHAVKAQPTISNPLAKGSACVMQCTMIDFTNVSHIT